MHLLSWFYRAAAFCLFVLGQRLITSAGVHALGPAALPARRKVCRAGALACFVTQSGLPAREIALAHAASGFLPPRLSARLALSGFEMLPLAVLLPPQAGCVLFFIALILTAADSGLSALWGRAALGLALFSLGRALMGLGEPYVFLDASTRAVLDSLYSPVPGLVICVCLAFLFQSAGAAGAFVVCSTVPLTAARTALLFAGCLLGESLRPLTRGGTRTERRFALFFCLTGLSGLGLAAASAALLAPFVPLDEISLRAALYPVISLLSSLFSLAVLCLPLEMPEREGSAAVQSAWHPRLKEMPPAALKALRRDELRFAGLVREQFASAFEDLTGDDASRRPSAAQPEDLPCPVGGGLARALTAVMTGELTARETALAEALLRTAEALERMRAQAVRLGPAVRSGGPVGRGGREKLAQAEGHILSVMDTILSALGGWHPQGEAPGSAAREAQALLRLARRGRRGKAAAKGKALPEECVSALEETASAVLSMGDGLGRISAFGD